jgi:hypothetical protein
MLDAGCGMRDAGCGMRDAGCGQRLPCDPVRCAMHLSSQVFHCEWHRQLLVRAIATSACGTKRYLLRSRCIESRSPSRWPNASVSPANCGGPWWQSLRILRKGHARSTRGEYRNFLSIARGSVAEVEVQLTLAKELGYVQSPAIAKPLDLCDAISRMITNLKRAF